MCSLSCTRPKNSFVTNEHDEQDCCNISLSEIHMDEYFNVNQRSVVSNTEEQLHRDNTSFQSSNLKTTVNLKLMKKVLPLDL